MPFLWDRKHFPDQEKKPCFFNNEDQTPEKHEKISEQQNRHLRAQNVKNTPQLLGFVIFLITSEMSNKVSLSNKKEFGDYFLVRVVLMEFPSSYTRLKLSC